MSDYEEEQYVSKTQRKLDSEEKQKLGLKLVGLTDANLSKIPMDEELEEAILVARKINKKKDGYRRQLQFIGKLLRNRDLEPLEQALDKIQSRHAENNAHFHQLEKYRDNIANGGDKAIQAVLDAHPSLERQTLRQFYRQIQKEKAKGAPPKAFRALFQYLKETLQDEG
ncbi:ribosome-associated protein [Alteromonas sediminis]|uniref:Dual-action ribosomal maturation protein DarP n=1 Tax=Alteromonas sediminis TaxID=2259342 RepID=A0A3N5Z528_9ALTE|nr:ribosome biogenesis factor YjgA [Alteromonas sediminis]RPJ65314.1 ribosome-associated protein [Alteromonas sediminis]